MGALSWTAIGILLTFSIFLANVIYQTGRHSARIEELERWRLAMRQDMHEISDVLEQVRVELKHLSTIIAERTERRLKER